MKNRYGFRWQGITWTNTDRVHRRKYAALGGDELTLILA